MANQSNEELLVPITGEITQELMDKCLDKIVGESGDSRILLMINSQGGSISAAIGFCNFMRELCRNHEVNTICLGVAASAAVPIFMLGKTRTMMPQSHLLLHGARAHPDVQALTGQQLAAMSQQIALLDKHCAMLIAAGSDGKLEPSAISEMMDAERVLSAEEALNAGLATAIHGQSVDKKP